MSKQTLPAPFRSLESYQAWSLPTERERIAKRIATPMADIIEFHGEMSKQLEDIIVYLNQYPYAEMPADAQNFCNLALSLVEISNLVEMYKNPALLNMIEADRFVPYE
jgi:hypothetical protein